MMSVSDSDRRQDKERTLCRMLALVGDEYFVQVSVRPSAKEFEDALPTTWRELLDDGLIDDKFSTMGSPAFRLTAGGWLRAMLLSGTVDTTDCRERCVRLAQALKSVVKGRHSHYDGLTTEHEIAAAANLPVGWVFNAIKSRLLGVVFPKDRWDATIDRRTIRVSPTFGLNHLFEERG
jgi:hypothetical protein